MYLVCYETDKPNQITDKLPTYPPGVVGGCLTTSLSTRFRVGVGVESSQKEKGEDHGKVKLTEGRCGK